MYNFRKKTLQKDCTHCGGEGGWYWDAPVYHNERQREWMNCSWCFRDPKHLKEYEDKCAREMVQYVMTQ